MKKISILLVILTCIFLCACNVISNSSDDSKEPAASSDTEEKSADGTKNDEKKTEEESTQTTEGMEYADGYGYAVSHVGWANGSGSEELSQWKSGRYPIFKIDTIEELDQFKSKWGTVFDFNQEYDEIPSFEDTMEKTKWDTEAFYKDHSLLVIYVESSSGTYRYGVKEIATTDSSMTIDVVCLNNPEIWADDMVGWLVLVEITDEEAVKYTSFITD